MLKGNERQPPEKRLGEEKTCGSQGDAVEKGITLGERDL